MKFAGQNNGKDRIEWELARLADPETGKIPQGIRAKEVAFAKTLPAINNYQKSGSEWTSRGPYNVSGRTRALGIDISNENILLAGSVSGGVWKTTDGGSNWKKTTAPDQHQSVTCIAQDKRPGKTNTWYYGTGEGYGASASGGGAYYLGDGLFKSTDNGETWLPLSATSQGSPQSFNSSWEIVWNVATHPNDTLDMVFSANIGGILKSINGGQTWSTAVGTNLISSYSYYTDVKVASSGVVYLALSSDGTKRGIWRSQDGIATFMNITPTNWPAYYERIVIGIDPNNENNVYFLFHSPGYGKKTTDFQGSEEWNSLWKYTYLSGDGSGAGGVWTDLSQNIPYDGSEFGNFVAQGSYNLVVGVKPGDSNTVFIGGTNLYRSTDGFTTSNNTVQIGGYGVGTTLPYFVSYPNHHADQHNFVFLPSNPDVMISSTDGGIYKTTDCNNVNVTWTSLNNGYQSTQFYTIALDHGTTGSNIITGGLQDWGSWFTNSSDPKKPWTFPSTGDGSFCAIEDGAGMFYYSLQRGKTLKATLDANGIVTGYNRIDPIGGTDYMFINPFIIDPVDNNVMYMAEGAKLWRNDSLAQIPLTNQFDSISTGWFKYTDTVALGGVSISALAASVIPSHRLYFGTNKRKVYRIDNANTGDPAFTEITGSTFPNNAYVSSIAVDPRDADKVLVVFSNYNIYSAFYSTDGGTSWSKVAGNLEQFSSGSGNGPSLRWATIMPLPDNGTAYLMGTSVGLFATDTLKPDSTVWSQLSPNVIGNVVVSMIDARASDGFVVAATHGYGVFSAFIKEHSQVNNVKEIAMNNYDFMVYPNPANEFIHVSFTEKKQNATLALYDETGKLIYEKKLSDNMAEFKLSVSQFSAGVYYLTATNGKYQKTKQVIIR
jgi:photosystem II stability/assembly factor-like uncharacterized protein